jgi:hypothetical protein
MVGPVVQRRREPESDRSPPFVPVSLVYLSHHRIWVERRGEELGPSRPVSLHDDASLGKRRVFYVDVECTIASQDVQIFGISGDDVAKGFEHRSPRAENARL